MNPGLWFLSFTRIVDDARHSLLHIGLKLLNAGTRSAFLTLYPSHIVSPLNPAFSREVTIPQGAKMILGVGV